MVTPRCATTSLAISRRRDGRVTFFARYSAAISALSFFLDVHLLEAPVFLFEFLHPGHHGGVHATELGTLHVKSGCADADFAAQIRNWQPSLHALERLDDLAV